MLVLCSVLSREEGASCLPRAAAALFQSHESVAAPFPHGENRLSCLRQHGWHALCTGLNQSSCSVHLVISLPILVSRAPGFSEVLYPSPLAQVWEGKEHIGSGI